VVRLERAELHVVPKLSGGNLAVLQMVDYASGLDALKRIEGNRDLGAGGASMLDLVCLLLVEATQACHAKG
jgi:5-methylcytosine-specific restriction enzyme subunit McrC